LWVRKGALYWVLQCESSVMSSINNLPGGIFPGKLIKVKTFIQNTLV